jgi:DNA-binding MarR family transcriptional regulator
MNRMETAEQLFDLFFLLKQRLVRHAARLVKQEFSPMQMHVLFTMLDRDVFSMSELAREVLISKQQLTPLVDKLAAAGLIIREADSEDRRVVKVRISSAGMAFLATHKREAIGVYEEMIASLSQDDLACLNDALNGLRQIIRKLP